MLNTALTSCRQFFNQSSRASRHRRTSGHLQAEVLETRQLLAATLIQAVHRSGQTFLTWREDNSVTGEHYNVYRSDAPITTANISQAEKLTAKWGPLDDNTSVNQGAAPNTEVPSRFVIEDLGTPLSANRGLFVYTTPNGDSGTWYYAVTEIIDGSEDMSVAPGQNTLRRGVSEVVATPQPVLTISHASGKGMIYTQYMDYANWNPTFQGYAYNYSVALPYNYDPNVEWPVKLMPTAYGERFRMEPQAEYEWPIIQIFVDDPGGGGPGYHSQTWWYGFSADHNYQKDGPVPTSGSVENFTEQRVLKAIDEVSSMFSVDTLRIHSQGHSMGASGSLTLGMRYADVFSGIFASEPMTNYAASPTFQEDFEMLWGSQASNLPIVNKGVHAEPLKKYDGLGVYNWMNHQQQIVSRRGEPMAFLMVGHGKADTTIDWATQGRPFIAALNNASVGFTAEQRRGWGHNWMGFDFSLQNMFSPDEGALAGWAYPQNLSFPGITRATGSGPEVPSPLGTNFYNMQFEWSVPWNHFHSKIVDTSLKYQISLRSTNKNQVAEITPQRVQEFKPVPGSLVGWRNVNNATGETVQSGTVTVDEDGLVTIPRAKIGTGDGNRLLLFVRPERPVLTSPAATISGQTPEIKWTGPDGVTFEVRIRNLSTGAVVVDNESVSSLSFTPTSELEIGRHVVRARSRDKNNHVSPWSTPVFFRINTPPVLLTAPGATSDRTPTVSWTPVAGASGYQIRFRRLSDNLVIAGTSNSESYTPASNLTPERYRVWVRAVTTSGFVSSWSSAIIIKVTDLDTSDPNIAAPSQRTFDLTMDRILAENIAGQSASAKAAESESNVAEQDSQAVTETRESEEYPAESDIDELMAEWGVIG